VVVFIMNRKNKKIIEGGVTKLKVSSTAPPISGDLKKELQETIAKLREWILVNDTNMDEKLEADEGADNQHKDKDIFGR